MTANASASARRSGRPEKRRAILHGARSVFAREGYARASIERIAAEAAVSTRTIYNHFTDKADLFRTVIEESATSVAESNESLIRELLDPVVESGDLGQMVRFGRRWAASALESTDHFALMGMVTAEARHIPPDAIRAWQEAGPNRVERGMAERFRRLDDARLLAVPDPERAAAHFMLLVGSAVAQNSFHGAVPLSRTEIDSIADAGVQAFLKAYRA